MSLAEQVLFWTIWIGRFFLWSWVGMVISAAVAVFREPF